MPRLFDVIDQSQVGHVGGVVQLLDVPVFHVDVIDNGDGAVVIQIDVILALDPVAITSRLQQAEEPTAEPKPRAADVSILGSGTKRRSVPAFRCCSRKGFRISAASTGNTTRTTTGCAALKPGSGGFGAFFLVRNRIADPRCHALRFVDAVRRTRFHQGFEAV